MKRRMLPIPLLATLLATAPLTGAARDEKPSRDRHQPKVGCLVADIVSDSKPRRRSGFRATRILGLEFETELHGRLEREHTLELRLYTPQGFLYQALTVDVDHEGRKRRRVEARLPVAGTSIMASGLYGRWQVVPHLDGARKPCGPARAFTIRP